jgi:hypothetical protein
MNNPDEFSTKEKFLIHLFKNPQIISKVVVRNFYYLIPACLFFGLFIYNDDRLYALVGFGFLVFKTVDSIFKARPGLTGMRNIIVKYETRIQSLEKQLSSQETKI